LGSFCPHRLSSTVRTENIDGSPAEGQALTGVNGHKPPVSDQRSAAKSWQSS
jgi:hypothetical protein